MKIIDLAIKRSAGVAFAKREKIFKPDSKLLCKCANLLSSFLSYVENQL